MKTNNTVNNKSSDHLKVEIKVTYTTGSKKDKAEFKAYALFGQWYANNYKKVRILDIKTTGNY